MEVERFNNRVNRFNNVIGDVLWELVPPLLPTSW